MHRRCILTHCFFLFRSARSASLPGSLNRTRRVRIHAPEGSHLMRVCACACMCALRACVRCVHVCEAPNRNFDTIRCTRRSNRAVAFSFQPFGLGLRPASKISFCFMRDQIEAKNEVKLNFYAMSYALQYIQVAKWVKIRIFLAKNSSQRITSWQYLFWELIIFMSLILDSHPKSYTFIE